KGVYAIGDVTNQNMLAHVAYIHAVTAVHHILHYIWLAMTKILVIQLTYACLKRNKMCTASISLIMYIM
ncbi:hypothetical protein, partial [Mycoplasmopsis bovis]|uniref:hypothetical protein n=1 Tax=Mycoplasmopsis bovis TaxID=28903 RepID=UPI003D2C66C2